MKYSTVSAATVLLMAAQVCTAETLTSAGPFTGVVAGNDIQSTGNTTNSYRRLDVEAWSDNVPPLPIEGDCSFSWGSENTDSVNFDCALDLGTHATDTHAKVTFFNIKSTQTFYDYKQQVTGTAKWDAASNKLTHVDEPDPDDASRRDDGRASTYSESKPAECDEADSRACKAFFKTSPELEGLVMKLEFNDDLSSYSGDIIMIQHGGSGMERSTARTTLRVEGTLTAQ